MEGPFDRIPIPICNVLESEPVAMAGRLQPRSTVNEKGCVVNLMFLAELREKHQRNCVVSRRIKSDMEQAVGVGIDSSVQPISV